MSPDACTRCGRPVLMDETGEREIRTCYCHWREQRYKAGPGPGVMQPAEPGEGVAPEQSWSWVQSLW